ncbi:MAG: DGQHR domain-containing protein [Chloroflexi bacterium]|nr:DGQHR domain-containing protein [Chloroflexota bacterium]
MRLAVYPFKQEGVQMYAGVAKVGDLLSIAKVDVWRQENGVDMGYQRVPETARTGKVARYLQSSPKALLPTSVLLSYRGPLSRGASEDGWLTVEIAETGTLWIVDGQHRLYGIQRAINELGLERLRDYPLPVVILENLSLEDEANQFRVINETMKKVRTDLARRILAMRISGLGQSGRQEVRMAGRLWEAVAVGVMRSLSQDADSPWVGRIQPPNVRKQSSHVIRELSFSTSLKPILNERPYRTWPADRIARVLKAYWQACEALIPSAFQQPEDYVLLKTPGVFSLHQLAYHVLEVLRARGVSDPGKSDFQNVLQDLGAYATEDFWKRDNADGAALAGSMKGFSILADSMEEELVAAGHTTE